MLTTRRLRLRTWRRSDMRAYDRHCNTPEVMAWLGGVMTPHELRQDYDYFERQWRRNGFTFWVVERKSDRAFLGFCGIVRVDEPGSTVFGEVEIGWRLRSDVWRHGYAFEAADRVLVYAFEFIEPLRIVSRVAPRNRPSQGLMRKLGMRRRPRLDYVHPVDGTLLRVYVITARTWREALRCAQLRASKTAKGD